MFAPIVYVTPDLFPNGTLRGECSVCVVLQRRLGAVPPFLATSPQNNFKKKHFKRRKTLILLNRFYNILGGCQSLFLLFLRMFFLEEKFESQSFFSFFFEFNKKK